MDVQEETAICRHCRLIRAINQILSKQHDVEARLLFFGELPFEDSSCNCKLKVSLKWYERDAFCDESSEYDLERPDSTICSVTATSSGTSFYIGSDIWNIMHQKLAEWMHPGAMQPERIVFVSSEVDLKFIQILSLILTEKVCASHDITVDIYTNCPDILAVNEMSQQINSVYLLRCLKFIDLKTTTQRRLSCNYIAVHYEQEVEVLITSACFTASHLKLDHPLSSVTSTTGPLIVDDTMHTISVERMPHDKYSESGLDTCSTLCTLSLADVYMHTCCLSPQSSVVDDVVDLKNIEEEEAEEDIQPRVVTPLVFNLSEDYDIIDCDEDHLIPPHKEERVVRFNSVGDVIQVSPRHQTVTTTKMVRAGQESSLTGGVRHRSHSVDSMNYYAIPREPEVVKCSVKGTANVGSSNKQVYRSVIE